MNCVISTVSDIPLYGGREWWNDQRWGSVSPRVEVVVVAYETALGGSLKWLSDVVTGENAPASVVVGVCVGAGFAGRRKCVDGVGVGSAPEQIATNLDTVPVCVV